MHLFKCAVNQEDENGVLSELVATNRVKAGAIYRAKQKYRSNGLEESKGELADAETTGRLMNTCSGFP